MIEVHPQPSATIRTRSTFWRRFTRHRMAVLGAVILTLLAAACFGATLVAPYPRDQQDLLLGPVAQSPLNRHAPTIRLRPPDPGCEPPSGFHAPSSRRKLHACRALHLRASNPADVVQCTSPAASWTCVACACRSSMVDLLVGPVRPSTVSACRRPATVARGAGCSCAYLPRHAVRERPGGNQARSHTVARSGMHRRFGSHRIAGIG